MFVYIYIYIHTYIHIYILCLSAWPLALKSVAEAGTSVVRDAASAKAGNLAWMLLGGVQIQHNPTDQVEVFVFSARKWRVDGSCM